MSKQLNQTQKNHLLDRIFALAITHLKAISIESSYRVASYEAAAKPTIATIHKAIANGEVKLRPRSKTETTDIYSFYNLDSLIAEAKAKQSLLDAPLNYVLKGVKPRNTSYIHETVRVHYTDLILRADTIISDYDDLVDQVMLGVGAEALVTLKAFEAKIY